MSENCDPREPCEPVVAPVLRQSRGGVFKTPVPLHAFYAFIHAMCPIMKTIITPIATPADVADHTGILNNKIMCERTFFTLDIIAFKRGIFMGIIDPFMLMLANECYHERYRFYAERGMDTPSAYTHFVQVIRHICKNNGIEMRSSLKYEQSQSNKVYHIEQKIEYDHTCNF